MNIHYSHQSEMFTDDDGSFYTGPAICGAIGSYATHYPVLINCERCREILRDMAASGNWSNKAYNKEGN